LCPLRLKLHMTLTEYKFSENEILRLKEYRDSQPDHRLKYRFLVLLPPAFVNEAESVASVSGICLKTVENWFRVYVL